MRQSVIITSTALTTWLSTVAAAAPATPRFRPRFLKQNADAGVDVMLCGHTHDGQFFPLNIAIRTAWENPAGLKKVGGMTSVVTSGVGVYGPDMRIGTDADISVVDIHFIR